MKYMLDTNICIYIIKKQPENVLKKFKSFDVGDICISSVTLAELRYGVEKSHHQKKNKAALEEFTLPLEVMAFDAEAACCSGHIKAYLEKKGTPIGSLDLMIAAHVHCLKSILVTNNTKEFSCIPKLKIEDWVHHN
jgi:tRNA(fMet)-specific endonuclease VapC